MKALGDRNNIIKTMHRALADVTHGKQIAYSIVGRVQTKGLAGDEMGDRLHQVIDGVAERGLPYAPSGPGEYLTERLAGAATLTSGRFAMIEDGLGFQLVPWQPVKAKPLRGGVCRASLDRLSLAQRRALQAGKADWGVDAPMPTQRAGVGPHPKEELAK